MLQIAESINREIKAHHRWHVAQNVIATVDSKQRTIKLSGRVISWHQKQVASKIASEVVAMEEKKNQSHPIKIINAIEVA